MEYIDCETESEMKVENYARHYNERLIILRNFEKSIITIEDRAEYIRSIQWIHAEKNKLMKIFNRLFVEQMEHETMYHSLDEIPIP